MTNPSLSHQIEDYFRALEELGKYTDEELESMLAANGGEGARFFTQLDRDVDLIETTQRLRMIALKNSGRRTI